MMGGFSEMPAIGYTDWEFMMTAALEYKLKVGVIVVTAVVVVVVVEVIVVVVVL